VAGRIRSIGKNAPHRGSNPQPCGSYHSASTNYAIVCPPYWNDIQEKAGDINNKNTDIKIDENSC
jgi:hypothetical protein